MTGITVGQAGDVLVAVKQAHDPEERARLRHEADLLGRLDHPGVVRFVDYDDGPPAALRTAFVGPDSWRTTTASTAGFAALTATLADLHDAGLVHGDLRADHVLVDADQRPILCGFAEAGPATTDRMQTDRTALASMLRREAELQTGAVGNRMRDAAGVLEEAALPTRAAIRLLDDRTPPDTEPRTDRPSSRTVVVAVGAAALLAIALATTAWLTSGSADRPPDAASVEPIAPTTTPPPTPPPTTAAPPSAVDIDPATVLVHDGRRYGIGAPGDVVHVADWDCDGAATPAVLRPTTGELAVFTTWPEPEATLLPSLAVTVDGAIDFAIDDRPCPELRIRTPNGSRLIEVPT